MLARDCCRSSFAQVDDKNGLGSFVETGNRDPIGFSLSFYTCQDCGAQWRRRESTAFPKDVLWQQVEQ